MPPYELELTVKPIKNYLLELPLPTGLIVGRMHSPVHGRCLYIDEKNGYAAIHNPYDSANKNLITLPIKEKQVTGVINPIILEKKGREYKLRAKIYNDRYEFWVDDRKVEGVDKKKFQPLLVSFGIIPSGSGKVEYKNMKIRALIKEK